MFFVVIVQPEDWVDDAMMVDPTDVKPEVQDVLLIMSFDFQFPIYLHPFISFFS